MEIKEIKSLDILSVAKFFAVIGLVFGFLFGLLGGFGPAAPLPPHHVFAFAGELFSYILSALFGAVVGVIVVFVGGAVSGFLYNFVANSFGGVKMELE
ncbi:MAG TPA: hypothetical protein O0X00_02420 [Methanocorpusculum sp.]|nr:hypothetical protein [Methanocorpusculum sp.]